MKHEIAWKYIKYLWKAGSHQIWFNWINIGAYKFNYS